MVQDWKISYHPILFPAKTKKALLNLSNANQSPPSESEPGLSRSLGFLPTGFSSGTDSSTRFGTHPSATGCLPSFGRRSFDSPSVHITQWREDRVNLVYLSLQGGALLDQPLYVFEYVHGIKSLAVCPCCYVAT
jgi:hypothetical protein